MAEAPSAEARTARLIGWLWIGVLAIFVLHAIRYSGALLDDAYISLRYAENWVTGQGLVFNPGERVEGYTNFLWVVLAAGFRLAGLDPLIGLKFVSAGATLWLMASTVGLCELCSGARGRGVLLFLLPLEAVGYWSTTSMETMLFAALFVAALLRVLREARMGDGAVAVPLLVLLALTRSDGALYSASMVGAAWLSAGVEGRKIAWRFGSRNALAFGLMYGSYFAWRWHYYGRPFPNTFYAKVTGGVEQIRAGLLSFWDWSVFHPLLASALLFAVALVIPGLRVRLERRGDACAVGVVALATAGYGVMIGGDFMPFHRFALPLLPLCAVLLVVLGRAWPLASRPARRLSLAVLVLVSSIASALGEETYRAFVADRTTRVGQVVGEFFRETLPADALIAVNTAGSLPYASGLPTLDTLGLTDAAVARNPVYITSPEWAGHRRGDGGYVLGRRPRVILWYNTAGLAEPHYLGDHQLAELAYFRFFYRIRRETLAGPALWPGWSVFAGTPFGDAVAQTGPGLGVVFEARKDPLPHTVIRPANVSLVYFELHDPGDRLSAVAQSAAGNLEAFVDGLVAIWREQAARAPPPPAAERARVEALCREARLRFDAGDIASAKSLLSQAAAQNQASRSALVPRYIANVAVAEGALWTAVQAQREALRLDPSDPVNRENLLVLLRAPWREFAGRSSRP